MSAKRASSLGEAGDARAERWWPGRGVGALGVLPGWQGGGPGCLIRGWACGPRWLGVFWNRWKSSLLITNLFENCLKTFKCFPYSTPALSHLRIQQAERSGLRAVTPSQSSTARRWLTFPGTLVESFEVKRVSAWVQFIHSFNKSLVPAAHLVPRWVKSSQDVSLRPWQLPLVVHGSPANQPKFASSHYYSLRSLTFFHFETVIKTLDKSWRIKGEENSLFVNGNTANIPRGWSDWLVGSEVLSKLSL